MKQKASSPDSLNGEEGEAVIIARHGQPVAELVPPRKGFLFFIAQGEPLVADGDEWVAANRRQRGRRLDRGPVKVPIYAPHFNAEGVSRALAGPGEIVLWNSRQPTKARHVHPTGVRM